MNDDKNPPQRVTRFYSNVDFALDVIANRQITFVHASRLNDPFDPYFFLETDFGERRGRLLKFVKEQYPKDLAWFKRHITLNSWNKTMSDLTRQMTSWREHTFIFSSSSLIDGIEPRDNLYMWGHYANGHRGVAIEFDTHELSNSVIRHQEKISGETVEDKNVWAKVEYRSDFPPLTAQYYYDFMIQERNTDLMKTASGAQTAVKSYLNLLGRVKSDVWQRECEWRLMRTNDGTRMKIYRCPISADAVKTIILGLNQSES